ncbi:hypothetical protein ACH5RR_030618 [Cinchona calisaya]|uniref:Uncharacterized protein n=1 Tax=Cinchona calisaya TaxID=153742 RepID=A0ABD2YZE5_9GENT
MASSSTPHPAKDKIDELYELYLRMRVAKRNLSDTIQEINELSQVIAVEGGFHERLTEEQYLEKVEKLKSKEQIHKDQNQEFDRAALNYYQKLFKDEAQICDYLEGREKLRLWYTEEREFQRLSWIWVTFGYRFNVSVVENDVKKERIMELGRQNGITVNEVRIEPVSPRTHQLYEERLRREQEQLKKNQMDAMLGLLDHWRLHKDD